MLFASIAAALLMDRRKGRNVSRAAAILGNRMYFVVCLGKSCIFIIPERFAFLVFLASLSPQIATEMESPA